MIARRGPLTGLNLTAIAPTLTIIGLSAVLKAVGMITLAWGLATAIAAIADGWSPVSAGAWSDIPGLSAAVVGIGMRAIASWISDAAAARMAVGFEHQLRNRLLRRTLQDPTVRLGGRSLLATSRLDAIRPYLSRYLPALASTAVIPGLVIGWLLYTDVLTGVIVALTVPLVPLFLALIGMHTAERTTSATRAVNSLANHVSELVRGLPVLVGLGRARDQAQALEDLSRRVRHRTVTMLRTVFLSSMALELLATMSVALVAVTVGLRLVHGNLDLHTGLLLLVLAPEAYAPFRSLGAAHHASEEGRESVTEVRALLDEPEGQPLPVTVDTRRSAHPPRISVTGLTVSHHGRIGNQVTDLDMTLQPRIVTLLDGPSGVGKTTVFATLTGRRTTDDADISGRLHGLDREKLAVVDQHPTFSAPTARAEVALHCSSLRAVDAALSDVGLTTAADRAPLTFSPGEKQRLALARAFARIDAGDATVLLLDEPTAHLDADTATAVIAALRRRTRHATTLLISHDPSCRELATVAVRLGSHQTSPTGDTLRTDANPAPLSGMELAQPTELERLTLSTKDSLVDRSTWRKLAIAIGLGIASVAAAIALTATSAWLIVRAAEQPPLLTLMVAIVGVRAFGLARAILRWAERVSSHSAILSNMEYLRLRLWDALTRRGPAVSDQAGERATTHLIGDLDRYQEQLLRTVIPPWVAAGAALVAIAIMSAILPAAGLIMALGVGTAVVGTAIAGRFSADDTSTRLRSELENRVTTVINGAADLHVHRKQSKTLDSIGALAQRQSRLEQRKATLNGVADAIVVMCLGITAIVAVSVGVNHGSIAPTSIAVLALTPLALFEPLSSLGPAMMGRRELRAAAQRLRTVVDLPQPDEPENPARPQPVIRKIHLTDVAVGWPGGPTVAQNINVHAQPDAWTVVTGPSGSGKSTTVATLLGFLRPRAGQYTQVNSDGTEIDTTAMRTDDIRAAIAWCPQEASVFDGTVRANLALSQPRGTFRRPGGEERMRQALQQVRLGRFVDSLPEGLDTHIGSGGRTLSGGERRRLAIARALLTDRPILVLDEPTAHVDTATAHSLMNDLRETLPERTVIVVTHDRGLIASGDSEVCLGRETPDAEAEKEFSSV